jgi:type I site-specific restriction endonuclease
MQTLNLPVAGLRIREQNGKMQIFDGIRGKFVSLTPEEWVRQHFVRFLVEFKQVPETLLAVEYSLRYNRMKKRSDIVVFGRDGRPVLMVECKAPDVPVSQDVFRQVAIYNMTLHVPYLVVTNGMQHYACRVDFDAGKFHFLKEIPDFEEMTAEPATT